VEPQYNRDSYGDPICPAVAVYADVIR